jgi:fructoselysine-6-P-deglycase FrlB-like protein
MTSEQIPAGLAAIEKEMARQHADALASYEGAGTIARSIAGAIRKSGRLVLLGMGGSHAVNRIAECVYRRLGIAAVSLPISEQLYSPLDLSNVPTLITSQSGESIEVHRLLESLTDRKQVFGLTLEGGSALGRAVPSLVGHGGTEHAFAATRSLLISLALHLRLLTELGDDPDQALRALKTPQQPDLSPAVQALCHCQAVVFSGRILRGLAEAAALGLMELGRMPAYALEVGQFRHGPLEILDPSVGVVVLRADEAGSSETLLRESVEAGSPSVLLDAGGKKEISGSVRVSFPKSRDIAAAISMLPPVQKLVIEIARGRVADLGTPRRSTKVTRSE